MKKLASCLLLCCATLSLQAGGVDYGIQLGAYSPTKGVDDNDNALLLGGHIKFKLAMLAIKVEGFYVDSSGKYASELGDTFQNANIDIKSIFAADLMLYPLATTFFLQAGVNQTHLDASGFSEDALDNDLGLEVGAGITLFDKLMVQGKIMYTPNAIKSDAANTIDGLSENLLGYMLTVGWSF